MSGSCLIFYFGKKCFFSSFSHPASCIVFVCGTPSGRMARRRARRRRSSSSRRRMLWRQVAYDQTRNHQQQPQHIERGDWQTFRPFSLVTFIQREGAARFNPNVANAPPPHKKIRVYSEKHRCPSASVTEEGTLHPGRHQQLASRPTVAANRLTWAGKGVRFALFFPLNYVTNKSAMLFSDARSVVFLKPYGHV